MPFNPARCLRAVGRHAHVFLAVVAENIDFQRFDGDQSREFINTQQRFQAYRDARKRDSGYRGSMSFAMRSGAEYLLRDYYDPGSRVRRQRSLGRRDERTEAIFTEFTRGKQEAGRRLKMAADSLRRQAAINRALGMGRVPEIGARIVRAVDRAGLLGRGLIVVGTNALFAYEASAGVLFPSEITTTEDIDLLLDAPARIRFGNALKRSRDAAQARWVGALVASHLPNLAFEPGSLGSIPRSLVDRARPLFELRGPAEDSLDM